MNLKNSTQPLFFSPIIQSRVNRISTRRSKSKLSDLLAKTWMEEFLERQQPLSTNEILPKLAVVTCGFSQIQFLEEWQQQKKFSDLLFLSLNKTQQVEAKTGMLDRLQNWVSTKRKKVSIRTDDLYRYLNGESDKKKFFSDILLLDPPYLSDLLQEIKALSNFGTTWHGVVISGFFSPKTKEKIEWMNANQLVSVLSSSQARDLVIDRWSFPVAYRSADQLFSELMPWMVYQTKGFSGVRSKKQLSDFKQIIKDVCQTAEGLYEVDLECLFFKSSYDPLLGQPKEFMIHPDQIKRTGLRK